MLLFLLLYGRVWCGEAAELKIISSQNSNPTHRQTQVSGGGFFMAKSTNTKANIERGEQASEAPGLFPMFVKLEGRECLVVGAGRIAESKIPGLLDAGAEVRVVAPQANATIASWAHGGRLSWQPRNFQSSDLDGVFLVIAATSLSDLNASVFREARQRNILCNAVDDPAHCDFYYPALVRRGALQLAISTSGLSPALAQRIRRELEEQFGPEYAAWLEQLGKARQELFAEDIDPEQRRQLLHRLASRESFAAAIRGGTQDQ
jgi:precorrin-2 dehydrogenase / sirohydrochlorin ferrochelatase